jgi:hypothetical protein
MTVYVVIETYDYNRDNIVAIYMSEAAAQKHVNSISSTYNYTYEEWEVQ